MVGKTYSWSLVDSRKYFLIVVGSDAGSKVRCKMRSIQYFAKGRPFLIYDMHVFDFTNQSHVFVFGIAWLGAIVAVRFPILYPELKCLVRVFL